MTAKLRVIARSGATKQSRNATGLWRIGITGPLFHFSDAWQLVINTATTIVTFLMVFLIQNTQNRDSAAVQLKLGELIRYQGKCVGLADHSTANERGREGTTESWALGSKGARVTPGLGGLSGDVGVVNEERAHRKRPRPAMRGLVSADPRLHEHASV